MKQALYKYSMIIVACLMISVAVNLFFMPHQLMSNGVTGIAIILFYVFEWPVGLVMIILNVPMLILAYKHIGRSYTVSTLFGILFLSVAIDLMKFLTVYKIVGDPLLSAIAGGVIAGVGAGLSFRANGSLGGLDILVTITKKYYSLNVGMVGFFVNFAITIVGAVFVGIELAIITLISMYIGSKVTDVVVAGFNSKKSVYIISYKQEEIIKAVLKEVGRGVTILQAEGAYTRQQKEVLFVVVRLTQVAKIKEYVREADPDAFMIIHDATEVLGRGFGKM